MRHRCALLLLLALGGCAGSSTPSTPSPDTSTVPIITAFPTPPVTTGPVMGSTVMGSTVTALPTVLPPIVPQSPLSGAAVDVATGMSATVLQRRGLLPTRTGPTNSYGEYLLVRLRNGGDVPQPYTASSFTLVNAGDTVFVPSLRRPHSRVFPTVGTMPVRGTVTGWIGFRVPRDSRTFTLRWDDAGRLFAPDGLVTYPVQP